MNETTTTRSERKQRTREEILAAAGRLFAEQGITATSTADVAAAVGLSHGALFVHFPTRDDLIAAVITQFGTEIAGRMHERVEAGAGVREVLRAHLDAVAQDEDLYRRLVIETPMLPSHARVTLTAIQSAVSVHLAEAAERDIAAGRVRRLPQALLFNTWIGLLHHYLVNRDLFTKSGSFVAERGEALLGDYLLLVGCEGGS